LVVLRIAKERRRRGWTQTQLAAKARLSASDVSRIETGRMRPYNVQAERLARALNLRVESLLDEVPETDD
jgi:ribosome-binding protein aMBF1 (putative translation factor)